MQKRPEFTKESGLPLKSNHSFLGNAQPAAIRTFWVILHANR